jgi:hypothetical protein
MSLKPTEVEIIYSLIKKGIFIDDDYVVSDCLWALSYIAEDHQDSDRVLEFLAQPDILHLASESLHRPDERLFMPALRFVGNVISANDPSIIDRCLFCNVLENIHQLIGILQDSTLVKECCWAASNVTASDNSLHVERFVESSLFPTIISTALNSNRRATKCEALWALCNAITGSDTQTKLKMLQISYSQVLNALAMGCKVD